jgi:hypothetical protein
MPAKSKAQYRYMQAVAHGWKPEDGPSKEQAEEFVSKQDTKDYKKLPEKKKKQEKKAYLRGYYEGYTNK